MKRLSYIIMFLGLVITLSCSSTKNHEATAEEINALNDLVQQKEFEFTARWAKPLTTTALNSVINAGLLPPGSTVNNIDLTGNSNYLRMQGDSVMAYLPYFGERQLGGAGYNPSNTAIQFEGVPDELEVNKKGNGYQISFNIRNKTETYQVNAQLFPNKRGSININSSHRFPIVYTGFLDSTVSN